MTDAATSSQHDKTVNRVHRGRDARRRTAFWLLRTIASLATLDGFIQAMLAGRFLAGDYASLETHATNASVFCLLVLLQAALFVLAWRMRVAPAWTVVANVGLIVAVLGQVAIGYANVVAVHVPLGVAIVAALAALTGWVWATPVQTASVSIDGKTR